MCEQTRRLRSRSLSKLDPYILLSADGMMQNSEACTLTHVTPHGLLHRESILALAISNLGRWSSWRRWSKGKS